MPALLVDHAKRLKDKEFQTTLERERKLTRAHERAHNLSQSLLHLGTVDRSHLSGLDPNYIPNKKKQLALLRRQVADLQQ